MSWEFVLGALMGLGCCAAIYEVGRRHVKLAYARGWEDAMSQSNVPEVPDATT